MRKLTAILSTVAALALAGVAGGGIVADGQGSAGNGKVAAVNMTSGVGLTTAFALGVWSSAEIATPVHVTYAVICQNPANDRSGSFTLLAGRFVSDEAFIFVADPNVASPWYGWDTCVASVSLTQTAADDHTLVAWLASHNGV